MAEAGSGVEAVFVQGVGMSDHAKTAIQGPEARTPHTHKPNPPPTPTRTRDT